MDKTHFFNLINAGNINSGLLSENFVRSHEDFANFPINLKGLPILIAADPAVFEFSSDDVFRISEKEIITKVYNLVNRAVTKGAFNLDESYVLKVAFEKISLSLC